MADRLSPEAQAALDAVRRRLALEPGVSQAGAEEPTLAEILRTLMQAIVALDVRLTKLEQR